MKPAGYCADAGDASPPAGLRGLFTAPQKEHATSSTIGRLGIFLLHHGFEVPVGIDHSFKKGDQFRLEVTATQNGWLYFFHRQANQPPELIWPQMKSGSYCEDNSIGGSRPVFIPPKPLSFHFDDQSGHEYLYVVINPERKVPDLVSATVKKTGTSAKQRAIPNKPIKKTDRYDHITNFTIRGRHDADGGTIQSVVSYPGINDADKYIYFKSPETLNNQMAIMEFHLRHE
jgi:hypothetical protein